MMDLSGVRAELKMTLAPSVDEHLSVEEGELCWVLCGQRILCQIWDQEDYWEVSFNESEAIGILEISKKSAILGKIIESLDRQPFQLIESRLLGIKVASWVESADGTPLVYEQDPDKSNGAPRFGQRVVVSTFG